MGVQNIHQSSTFPTDTSEFITTQTVITPNDSACTLAISTTLVHNIITRVLKIDYPWAIEPNPDSASEYDSETSPSSIRQVNSLPHGYIVDREYELLTKFLDVVGLSIQAQALLLGGQKMKPGFIVSKIMAWLAGQHRTPKSLLNKQSCIKAVLKLKFDGELMQNTLSALTYREFSNCNVPV
ncbi:MAG: hypothetical protein EZS28_036315 [Streblomastix strix]|uniref:Uncharacterized protein n=1 Tax=Streblomastix strix TaxID=222440 RepID=A0A5J4UCB7_9EUKA|nr:MAG: hypothetical protein EZS28_036315 [Streblomastix strix]